MHMIGTFRSTGVILSFALDHTLSPKEGVSGIKHFYWVPLHGTIMFLYTSNSRNPTKASNVFVSILFQDWPCSVWVVFWDRDIRQTMMVFQSLMKMKDGFICRCETYCSMHSSFSVGTSCPFTYNIHLKKTVPLRIWMSNGQWVCKKQAEVQWGIAERECRQAVWMGSLECQLCCIVQNFLLVCGFDQTYTI